MKNKIKILFIRPTMGKGGADRVTWQLLKFFDRERFIVSLGVMRAEGDFMDGIPEDVDVINFRAKSLYWMVLPLYRHLKTYAYDYLYSTSGGTNIVAGVVKQLIGKGLPAVVLSERSSLFPPHKGAVKKATLKVLKGTFYQKAKWVTAVSHGILDQLEVELSLPRTRLKVVRNPLIDGQLMKQKEELIDQLFQIDSYRTIVAVGRFVPQKDYPTLIRAFSELIQNGKYNDLRLLILGDGPLLNDIKNLIRVTKTQDSVILMGYQKNPYKYMARADIFVLSSLHEGLPGVLVQAMACGAACVSTNCRTGPSELITDGIDGFLVPVGDHTALAQRMEMLLENPALRNKFREAAPAAVRRYQTDQAIRSYFEFL
ncbi:glycosyltransferase involved in cell wall biosynthesis [Lewinella aquimaris]|uniref:Glycosyltransferase involved in cell wall biosynthesis n=1 Tax=Neolewinella aquimaris TaxID=1835722 RepID=A0A840EH41_9BACT|nr:glycosyltransferase [Neolewinella aquimaris]MBB4080226.1 glycosyltransferase involved in cell wall biosynthesis [Neolewinella aquimaris]